MKKKKTAKRISEDRILAITNNVSEEYTDLGRTDFATKEEFCQVIQYLQKENQEERNKFMKLKSDILGLYIGSDSEKTQFVKWFT